MGVSSASSGTQNQQQSKNQQGDAGHTLSTSMSNIPTQQYFNSNYHLRQQNQNLNQAPSIKQNKDSKHSFHNSHQEEV